MGELGVLDAGFAELFAPIAGFRTILVHEYLGLNWDEVYNNLQRLDDILKFADAIRKWMGARD